MLNVAKNQHRWKLSLGDETRRVLEEAAETLAWAWEIDRKYPKSYPANTGQAFFEIRAQIRESQTPRRQPTERKRSLLPLPPPPPKRFSDLIDDRTIKVVYEDQNASSYKNALALAARGHIPTFRKILHAIEKVYDIDRLGLEVAPPPRIHFLHKNLLEIANLSGLNDLSDSGIIEFLQDLCPCGKVHQPDAIRKFRKRWAGFL
jgi:hypothetical protein